MIRYPDEDDIVKNRITSAVAEMETANKTTLFTEKIINGNLNSAFNELVEKLKVIYKKELS